MTGIELIAAERRRQIEVEGWTPEHDAQHVNGELAQAAAAYCYQTKSIHEDAGRLFPPGWDREWFKREGDPAPTDRDLVKAGALIAAELDRRAALNHEPEKEKKDD